MASRRRRLHRALSTVALPGAAFGLMAALPVAPVHAQAIGADLKVVNPHPGAVLGSSAFSLDVSFKSRTNAPIVSTELYVDGVRWVQRNLDNPQIKNVLSFAVDSSSLSAGSHTFLVRVITANGGAGEATLQVVAGNDQGHVVATGPSAPDLTFLAPVNGRSVMGQVELQVDAPQRNGMSPYVTIYVDNQFKSLTNQPPYTYTWDTTNVPNGPHTIQATGYLGTSDQSTTRTIRVFVNNPGGNTDLKHDIPDLSRRPVLSTANTVAISLPTRTVKPAVAPLVPIGAPIVSVPHADVLASAPSLASAGMESALKGGPHSVQAGLSLTAPAAPARPAHRAVAVAPAHSHVVATAIAASASVSSARFTTAHVEDVQAAPIVSVSAPSVAIRPASAAIAGLAAPQFLSRASAATAVAPSLEGIDSPLSASVSPRTVGIASLQNAAQVHPFSGLAITGTSPVAPTVTGAQHVGGHAISHVSTHSGPRVVVHGQRLKAMQPIQVAFNGQQIVFDVQPRVEAGLPIAPFRQIFEHTGGQVDWIAKTQVVHAVNADKEIVITVGKSDAVVNGQKVSMDRAAFVDRGRTIVPLSFVGAALDCTVKYDAATGRLQITSK